MQDIKPVAAIMPIRFMGSVRIVSVSKCILTALFALGRTSGPRVWETETAHENTFVYFALTILG